ncbi:MAG: glyoxylate/hydroxypyruvate reductase A [Colwellia sp.]|nr:glyoxylate/hydroxypyruvate reductase A [Colwellia sp.]
MMINPAIAFISQLPLDEQASWQKQLSQSLPNETIVLAGQLTNEQKQQCNIAIVANPDPQELMQFSHLLWCQSLWAGVDALVSAFSPRVANDNLVNKASNANHVNFSISRLIDPLLAQTMSEAVLTWTLYLHREMHQYQQQQRSVFWRPLDYKLASERTVGILGLGELGKVSALRLKANGFNVLGWSRNKKDIKDVCCLSGEQGLKTLAQQSNIIVCLLPLTADTQHLINQMFLQELPPQACIINFARGGIINNDDLLSFLKNDPLSYAVLDVFDQEPLSLTSEFWHHPQITVLPHISAPTNRQTATTIVADNINHYRQTGQLPPCIDLALGY